MVPHAFPYQIFKEDLTVTLKLLNKIETEGTFPDFIHKATITLIPKGPTEKENHKPICPLWRQMQKFSIKYFTNQIQELI